MKKERIEIVPKNVYLVKDVNYSDYKNIYEWECLFNSQTAYKFCDKITNRVFWIEKSDFRDNPFGNSGYYTFECIHDQWEERKRLLEQLTKK